jgi:hypothetical protein
LFVPLMVESPKVEMSLVTVPGPLMLPLMLAFLRTSEAPVATV